MKWLTILFFFLISFFSSGQKKSEVYDLRGRLIADTLFSIDKKQLKFFNGIEDSLIRRLVSYQVVYPEQMREENMSDNFVVEYQLTDSNTFYNVQIGNLIVHKYSKNFFLPIVITNLEKMHRLSNTIPKNVSNKKFYLYFKFYLKECNKDSTYFSQGMFIIRGKRPKITTVY